MLRWLIVALGAFLVVPAAASAESESVTSGTTTATLTWDGAADDVKDAKLTITRAGTVAFDQAIRDAVCDGCALPGNGADDVKLVDLDGLGDPEVIVTAIDDERELTAGFYSFNATTGTYDGLSVFFGAEGFNLDDLDHDGRPEIVATDTDFDVVLSAATRALAPPQVLIFTRQDDRPLLAAVTSKYPKLIRSHASRVKRALAKARSVTARSELIGPYLADEYLLGHGATGLREFDRLAKAGRLGTPATAKGLRRNLLTVLKQLGYR